MKTRIKTAHEEEVVQNGMKKRYIGVLVNYSVDQTDKTFSDSFAYYHFDEMYVIFNTIVEMLDYIYYSEKRMFRAYLTEEDFDKMYDTQYIDGTFKDVLTWTNDTEEK